MSSEKHRIAKQNRVLQPLGFLSLDLGKLFLESDFSCEDSHRRGWRKASKRGSTNLVLYLAERATSQLRHVSIALLEIAHMHEHVQLMNMPWTHVTCAGAVGEMTWLCLQEEQG